MQTEPVTVVISVADLGERSQMLNRILTNLTKEPIPATFKIVKSLNKIEIFHIIDSQLQILIKTYLIIIVPISVDIKNLDSVTGVIDFYLDETIERLQAIITNLQARQGRKVIRNKTHGEIVRQLDRCLC